MQDFQSIPGLAGRIFGVGNGGAGGGGAPDHRRLRGYPGGGGQEPPAKCPRCESTNTKFCYYNNYNLSQPRHFCKSCRRYWTKGGVLRNVPVGGGCRKSSSSKRSSSSSSSTSKKSSSKDRRRPPASSHSSSDSSSLTAASDPAIFVPNTTSPNPSLEPDPVATEPQTLIPGSEIFSEPGSFTSLMTAGPGFLGLNFSDPPLVSAAMIDQSAAVDLAKMGGGGGGGGGINGLDWPAVMDPAFFDLTSAVDPGGYWNQGQWGDTDPNLYLP